MNFKININLGERWFNLKENENYYISNKGRIRNANGEILKPFINNSGYYCIGLWKDNVKKTYCVHKLVAKYFLSNYNENLDIDHIDNNKLNNDIRNLCQISHKENCIKRITPNVYLVTKEGEIIKTFSSFREAGKELGFSPSTLRKNIQDNKITCIYNKIQKCCMYFNRY